MATDLHLETLGVSKEEKEIAARMPRGGIDPAVSVLIAATNGNAYKHLIGQQFDYPIPNVELPAGNGRSLLEIGCGWGRWSIAAARKGYRVVGIDPSQGAVMAAQRVADQLGVSPRFMCADARELPFPNASFDTVFSYSVVQHFSRVDASRILKEIGRILRPGGISKIQMANRLGLRSLYVQARRGFKDGSDFDVRYWTVGELRDAFTTCIGSSQITAHCFFGLGLETSDIGLMPRSTAALINASDKFRRVSMRIPWLLRFADSVYVTSKKI